MPNPVTFALDTVAVYRLTKLITEDKLTEEMRHIIHDKFPPVTDKRSGLRRVSMVEYLFNCPWCVSVWAAGFIFTLRKISPETANYLSSILAASALTGISISKGI